MRILFIIIYRQCEVPSNSFRTIKELQAVRKLVPSDDAFYILETEPQGKLKHNDTEIAVFDQPKGQGCTGS